MKSYATPEAFKQALEARIRSNRSPSVLSWRAAAAMSVA